MAPGSLRSASPLKWHSGRNSVYSSTAALSSSAVITRESASKGHSLASRPRREWTGPAITGSEVDLSMRLIRSAGWESSATGILTIPLEPSKAKVTGVQARARGKNPEFVNDRLEFFSLPSFFPLFAFLRAEKIYLDN